jgi:hypothetical protein
MARSLFARKPLSVLLAELHGESRLRRVLGPALMLSYVVAGWLPRHLLRLRPPAQPHGVTGTERPASSATPTSSRRTSSGRAAASTEQWAMRR